MIGTIGAVAVLMLSGVGVAGASTGTSAPFRGSVATYNDYLDPVIGSSCEGASFSHAPHWSPATGLAGSSEKAHSVSSPTCTSQCYQYYYCYSGSATASVYETIAVPIATPSSSGYYDVVANWSFAVSASWSIAHGPCPKAKIVNGNGYEYCSISTQVEFVVEYYCLWDVTGRQAVSCNYPSYYYPLTSGFSNSTDWYHQYSCSSYSGGSSCTKSNGSAGTPTGSTTFHGLQSYYINGTSLNRTHHYAWETTLYSFVQTSVYGYPTAWKATASASVSAAGKSNYARMVSVQVY